MKTISLKIDDSIFSETEEILSDIQISRNRYINDALDYYNRIQKRKLLGNLLKAESALVKENSRKVLKEFEDVDYGS